MRHAREPVLKSKPQEEALLPFLHLGIRIRHARMLRGMTLKALAETARCSESLLSRIERNQTMPSLATLHRLACALDSNVMELAQAEAPRAGPVIRAGEHPVVRFGGQGPGRPGIRLERVVTPARGQLLQADIHILEAGAASLECITHAGEEVGYVIEGELELGIGTETYLLGPGDTFHFPSDRPHSYRNPGRAVTRVFWSNTPATF